MRVYDVENSIYDGLRGMEWYRYLRAMWIIGGDLRQLFDDRTVEPERSMIAETLDLVRSVAESENVPAGSARLAADLAARWEQVIDEDGDWVYPGHFNMWMVFGMLATEVAGGKPYFGAERVYLALTKRFRENPNPDGRRRLRVVDPNEEVADDSPMAQALGRAQRIVDGVARIPDSVKDPVAVRDQIFAC